MSKTKGLALIAAGVLVSAFLKTQELQAQEIEVGLPDGKIAKVDCKDLHVEDGQIWFPKEVIDDLDAATGGQQLGGKGLTAKVDLSPDKKTRLQQLSTNMMLYGDHLAKWHSSCITSMARIKFLYDQNPYQYKALNDQAEEALRMYGEKDIKELSTDQAKAINKKLLEIIERENCVISEVKDGCRTELGL